MAGGNRPRFDRSQVLSLEDMAGVQDAMEASLQDTQAVPMRDGRLFTGTHDAGLLLSAGTSMNLAHGLGRRHRGGWCVRPMNAAGALVYELPGAVPAALLRTHLQLWNPAATDARFWWWVF